MDPLAWPGGNPDGPPSGGGVWPVGVIAISVVVDVSTVVPPGSNVYGATVACLPTDVLLDAMVVERRLSDYGH